MAGIAKKAGETMRFNKKRMTALLICFLMSVSAVPDIVYADNEAFSYTEWDELEAVRGESVETDLSNEESQAETDQAQTADSTETSLQTETTDIYDAGVPGIDSEVSKENALAILKAYDSDGSYIVNFMLEQGVDNIEVFLSSGESNARGLDTVVHENYHSYSYYKPSYFYSEAVYIGNQQDIDVPMNTGNVTVFPTSDWAETLPDELRTFRFDTYVSESSNTSANVKGPYGLINEFTAYCWGMHNQLALFPYYRSQGNTFSVWKQFVNSCCNNRQAYAEFRFWILGYLNYAKANAEDVYNHFMNNQDFLNAYLTIEERFEKQISEFDLRCTEIIRLAAADGITASFDDEWFWFAGRGTGTLYSEYSMLMEELSGSEYQKIEEAIRAKGAAVIVPDAPELAALKNSPDGVSISWKEVDGASKYKIYRKASGGSWESLKTTAKAGYSDSSALMGTKYAYRVKAYNGSAWSGYSSSRTITFNPFTDVSVSDTVFRYISWAYNLGIVAGTGDGSAFSPGSGCTRISFVMMLWKMNGSPEVSGDNPFTDVTGSRKEKAVLWAFKSGLVNGTGDSTFSPSKSLTRGSIVMILWKMAGSPRQAEIIRSKI